MKEGWSMYFRKTRAKMSSERFERWFTAFKRPYTQEKFIYSYKHLENDYTELVIKYLLTTRQKYQVQKFIKGLPKMNSKRFANLLKKIRRDPGVLGSYSYKDFTPRQKYILLYHLMQSFLKDKFREIWS